MSTLKAEILRIEKVENHPNADRLDLVQVKDWICVVQKGSFNERDLCLYIPIDSILPEIVEMNIFGTDSKIKLDKYRVRTIKLRGIISQGLVIKPEQVGIQLYKEGQDFTETLNITKYEPSNCRWVTVLESNRNKGNVKLSLKIANAIRELYATGNYTYKQLAEKYNIDFGHIGQIIRNEIWKNE